jgi:hypothetical protein
MSQVAVSYCWYSSLKVRAVTTVEILICPGLCHGFLPKNISLQKKYKINIYGRPFIVINYVNKYGHEAKLISLNLF